MLPDPSPPHHDPRLSPRSHRLDTEEENHKKEGTAPRTGHESRKWKRRFMEAERIRRKSVRRWEKDLAYFADAIADCERTIDALKAELDRSAEEHETAISVLKSELRHARTMRATQAGVIKQMQKTLQDNGIPVRNAMASLNNCRARDDEVCPLSLAPINQSPLPMSEDGRPSTLVLNPMRPDRRCAELPCGHRFNSLWLIYHFVERNTFCCPVCRSGQENFRFRTSELPPGAMQMLEGIAETRQKRKAPEETNVQE